MLRQAARLQQAGTVQRRARHQGARPEDRWGGDLVRLLRHQCGEAQLGLADPHPVAGRQPQPFRHHRVERDGILGQRHRRLQTQRPVQRIGAVHRLQLDQHSLGRGSDQHGPQADDLGDVAAAGGDPGPRLRPGRAGAAAQFDIAAEQPRPIRRQPRLQPGPQGADRGDGGDTKGEAGQHDAQRARAATQVSPRQPGAKRQLTHHAQAAAPAVLRKCHKMARCAGHISPGGKSAGDEALRRA
ncbi:hypothetical protein ACFQU2_24610 [Siccirubricoccus deserti]